MLLYHYLVARCFAVTFVCPIPRMTEGLLPRLAFGPVTKTAWMLYLSLGRLYIRRGPYVIRHSICVSLSETNTFPPNLSTGYHGYMWFT